MTRALLHILALLALLFPAPAAAHFLADSKTREIHVLTEPDWNEAEVILRFPLTMSFATALLDQQPGQPMTAPFLGFGPVNGKTIYHIDQTAYEDDLEGFVDYLLKDYRFTVDGREVEPELGAFSLADTRDAVGPFPGLIGSLELLYICNEFPGASHIADLVVTIQVYLPDSMPGNTLGIEVTTPPVPLPPTLHFDTMVVDHRFAEQVTVGHAGFVPPPIMLAGSRWQMTAAYLQQGAMHILTGLDHLLFVLCLALAATSLGGLVWAVTGFALGHSVTLTLGMLGYLPQAGWLVPAADLGAALAVMAMAALVLVRRSRTIRILLATALGLLHGLGFATILAPKLGPDGLAVPLASFNIGIELGQLAIVLAVFLAVLAVARVAPRLGHGLRLGAAGLAAIAALTLAYDQTAALIAEFPTSVSISKG